MTAAMGVSPVVVAALKAVVVALKAVEEMKTLLLLDFFAVASRCCRPP